MSAEGKSIRTTAIITFSLIGIPFLLTKCSNNDLHEKDQTTHSTTSPYTDDKPSNDSSFKKRDQEIALASYTKDINSSRATTPSFQHNEQIEIGGGKPLNLNKHHSENLKKESQVSKTLAHTETTQILKTIPPLPTATPPAEIVETLQPVDTNKTGLSKIKEIQHKEETEKSSKNDIPNVPQALTVISTTKEIIIPQATSALDIEKAELARKLDTKTRSEKMLQDKIVQLKDENKNLLNQLEELNDSKVALKKKISDEIEKREKEIEKLEREEASLEEKQHLLEEENHQLLETINNLESRVQEATQTSNSDKEEMVQLFSQEKELKEKEIKSLSLKQMNLEGNLSKEREKEALLNEENQALKNKINTLLSIAEEATSQVSQAQEIQNKKVSKLLQKEQELEANLSMELENETQLMAERTELESKITKLLSMAKMMSQKGTELQKEKNGQIQSLLSAKIDLESNLSKELEREKELKEENQLLQTKITRLLSIAEEATSKITTGEESKNNKFGLLMSQQQNLEANLSSELEKEAQLKAENEKLQASIAELTAQVEEAKANDKTQELQALMSQQQNLEANLTTEIEKKKKLEEEKSRLLSKITKLLSMAEIMSQKGTNLQKEKNSQIQSLLSTKVNLEANLSSELEKEAQLKAENEKLQASIAELTAQVEEAKANDKTQELQTLMSQQQNLEANLSSELEKEAQLKAENEKLLQEKLKAEKALQERMSLLNKEKAATAAALLLVKETKTSLEKLAQEKEKAEALAKQKAEEVAKVKEAAAAKEAEFKEREARKRAAAKEQLSNAFSLTHVEFKYNSMDLTSKSKKLLNETAKVMKRYAEEFHFIIQGHTDNTGKESYNVKLSGQRADQVKKYLVSQGVPAEILSTEGIGSAQPIADNNTKAGRLQNRRVVFQIVEN